MWTISYVLICVYLFIGLVLTTWAWDEGNDPEESKSWIVWLLCVVLWPGFLFISIEDK